MEENTLETTAIETVTTESGTSVNVYGDTTSEYTSVNEPFIPVEGTVPAIIESIFGQYSPRTETVTTVSVDGSSVTSVRIVDGVAGMDFAWISGVLTFSIVLYGFISILRVVLKNG